SRPDAGQPRLLVEVSLNVVAEEPHDQTARHEARKKTLHHCLFPPYPLRTTGRGKDHGNTTVPAGGAGARGRRSGRPAAAGAARARDDRGLGVASAVPRPGWGRGAAKPAGQGRGYPQGVVVRPPHPDLPEPEVVQKPQERDDVDEPVEAPPGDRAETPDHAG